MTNRIVKYTALLSLLVFAYPIAFMTFHVLHDHMPEDSCAHSCCSHTNPVNAEENPEDADYIQISKNSHCLICEYEFAKTNIIHTEVFLHAETFTSILCEELCSHIHLIFSGTNKSLRAPPAIT